MTVDGPVALALTRQNVPFLDPARFTGPEGVARGAYILREATGGSPEIVLMATGSEVSIAAEAQEKLEADGVRVRLVSMPSLERFAAQPDAYRVSVLPPEVPLRIAIEAGIAMPWYRWVGDGGHVIALDHFGASAPYERIYQEFGITAGHIVEQARTMLG
jgi:transketolase